MNETVKRLLSGVVYILLLLGCVLHSKETLALLFFAFMLIAVYEFCQITGISTSINIILSGICYYFLWNSTTTIHILLTLVAVSYSVALLYYLFNHQLKKLKKIYYNILLFGYIVIPFVLINYITIENTEYQPKTLLSIFILIWTNDTFAYLTGKNFGKNKLFATISPKKTIEGFLGGLFFTIIASILLAIFYTNYKTSIAIVLGIVITIFSTLGDLVESKFKRIANIKDSGNIMPGHGGILDRLDSIIFVIPFVYLFFLILNYVS